MKKLLSFALIILFCCSFLTGCKKDKGDPPALPPQETMVIDFSNFTSSKKSVETVTGITGTANSNWEFAATVAGVWKVIISTTLAVPVASFKLATDQTPVWIKEKTWQWTYSVTLGSVAYKARLTGEIGSSDATWKMYVTKDGAGGFAEFLWFQGTSKLDKTSGQWILNQSPEVQQPILQIDWTKSGNSIGTVKYTYIKNSDQFNSSYIECGSTSTDLNAYFTVHYYNGVKFSDVNIEWNTTTKNGRVKSIDYLGDNNWYCWDTNKVNTTCQ